MKVLRVRPKHYPEVIDIDYSLESLQKEVEGPIQAVYPWDDEVPCTGGSRSGRAGR